MAITADATTSTSRGANADASQALAAAATATPPYPAASLRPSANPRRRGPTRSIFITTVIDQARPWLITSQRLAATIHAQVGAAAGRTRTGGATAGTAR